MARGVRLQFSPAQAEQDLAIQLAASSVVRRFGPVEQQHAYIPGRQFKADFAIASVRLLIEVQGGITAGRRWRTDPATGQRYQVEARGAHGSVEGVLKDNERLNLATLHGWSVLRFTPGEVATHEAITFIERYLAEYDRIAQTDLQGNPVYDNTRGEPCPSCAEVPLPCARCAEAGDPQTHDPCLGHIDGATSACCGHGTQLGHVLVGAVSALLQAGEGA